MVILALDYGEKRIGAAVTDPGGVVALGLPTIERNDEESEFDEIARLVTERQAERIVVGMPLNMDGSEGRAVHRVRGFIKKLRRRLPQIPVETVDERLSTDEAQQVLSEARATDEQRARNVDRLAAQIILQRYLDRRSRRGQRRSPQEDT